MKSLPGRLHGCVGDHPYGCGLVAATIPKSSSFKAMYVADRSQLYRTVGYLTLHLQLSFNR